MASRFRGRIEALAERLSQSVDTVTRSSSIFIEKSGVEDIDPPEDLDELHALAIDVGIIRANLSQFVRDTWKPGVRVEAESDETEAFFNGGDTAPSEAPPGGFLDNCGILAEKRLPFYPFGKITTFQRWSRGTNIIEYARPEGQEEDPDARITGFKHIRPETVSARTYAGTNILLDPDDTETAARDEITKRGEAAAWVQYDDSSILGRRLNGIDDDEVLLSQNDVVLQTLEPDIGGPDPEDGVYGIPITRSIKDDATEYRDIKRDWATAIKAKAWGVWDAQFNTEVTELPEEVIIKEWSDDEQDDWIDDVDALGPGDILGHDGSIELTKWEPDVPQLEDSLQHYVDDIIAPLPAPKYATAHGEQITQHVTDRQENAYHDTIDDERQYQGRSWTGAFRDVAESWGLPTEGLRVAIEPEPETNPVFSFSDEEMERLSQFANAFDKMTGTIPADSILDMQAFLELVMDLPEDVLAEVDEAEVDESDQGVQDMVEDLGEQLGAEAD